MSSGPAASSTAQISKPQRVLACVQCQQRKIKCDRQFPCANCIKVRAQCIPASQLPRQRRRRFPERKLLDQLHKYEHLLRQNNVQFEPLHKGPSDEATPSEDERARDADASSPSTMTRSEGVPAAKDFWRAMRQTFQDEAHDTDSSHEDVETVAKRAWDQTSLDDDPLIFGTRQPSVDLSTLHPEPVEIFKLWQLYIDNVNPLQRVIHVPTMQVRIIEAASNMSNINPVLEALLFSIYSMAILSISLVGDECPSRFGSSKNDLLIKYQFGCQQALLRCGFLRCNDRDCLTALYLYMVSISTSTDPRALSSVLGLAIRIAQRMRIDSETANSQCNALEAEMRRRLWWSLVFFDTRVCQIADYRTQTLSPLWDCPTLLNVNDTDLRVEMTEPPAALAQPSEAIFVVVRSELGDFIRNSAFHLDVTALDLRSFARNVRNENIAVGEEAIHLEKMIEDKYLKFCDPEHPLHFMTIWETRRYLATFHLMEFYTRSVNSNAQDTGVQSSAGTIYALRMLEADTKIMTSLITKPYRWMMPLHFPFPAYIALTKELGACPVSATADQAWETMSDNCEARFLSTFQANGPMFRMFTKLILRTWSARERVCSSSEEAPKPPRIVSRLKHAMEGKLQTSHDNPGPVSEGTAEEMSNFSTPMPVEFGGSGLLPDIYGHGDYGGSLSGQNAWGYGTDQFDWTAMGWAFGQQRTW